VKGKTATVKYKAAKKKAKKGTYKFQLKVYAAGNANYKAGYKIVNVAVKVK
jgi:hypothetical protein